MIRHAFLLLSVAALAACSSGTSSADDSEADNGVVDNVGVAADRALTKPFSIIEFGPEPYRIPDAMVLGG